MIALCFKLVAAIAPAIVMAMLIIRRDKLRPEPTGWLMKAAGLGVVAGIIAIIVGLTIIPRVEAGSFFAAFYKAFIEAALPEETVKLCMLFIIASRCKYFDEYFDGIVYAVCIGMGFAGFENIIYLFGSDNWLVVGISRALLSVPAHYFFAVIMGAFFALGRFDKQKRTTYYMLALIVPVVVHGLYDFFCFSTAINTSLSLVILIVFLVCFKRLGKYVRRLSDHMLKLDSDVMPTE